ncbi:MAG: chemotaxis protein CheR [Gammaproteobacteria bacterium]|nr:protein-glutamate O-methyltransferase [Gammaproteobacteria bacterium]PCH63691.1 MAG: chemotaxis protein CheR [Gammaproteobacteria bacterium]
MVASVAGSGSFSELEFTDADFKSVRDLVRKNTGISLSEAKRDMVYSRLVRRLRELNLQRFSDYLALVCSDGADDELIQFTNAITTNLTSFFREGHHFEYLAETVLPELMRQNADVRKIRIWCCAASTGEEPYSIAMVVKEVIPKNSGWDVKILATDLDTNVLATAEKGIYPVDRIKDIPAHRQRRFFLKGGGKQQGHVRIRPELQQIITYKKLNLMDQWPLSGPIDIIFCRNVVIYFTKDTQKVLLERFTKLVAPGAHLFMGHSESLNNVTDKFQLLGRTIYRFAE